MADADLATLVVRLEASTKEYQRQLARAQGTTVAALRKMERDAAASGKRIDEALSRGIGGLRTGLGLLAGAVGVAKLRQLADSFTGMTNALKVAGLQGEDLNVTFEQLYGIAQKNAVPLDALVKLFGRAAQAGKELKASNTELLAFTDNVAKALKVAGTSPEEASGALLQLGQLLGAGKVQAEEFNSVNEGARPILEAVASGLKEAGGSVATLKKLVTDGKVSSEAFFRAFEAGAPMLEQKLAGASATAADGLTRLNNEMTTVVGRLNTELGASNTFNDALKAIGDFAKSSADELLTLLKLVDTYRTKTQGLGAKPADVTITGPDGSTTVYPGQATVSPEAQAKAYLAAKLNSGLTGMNVADAYGNFYKPGSSAVSLANFKVPGSEKAARADTSKKAYAEEVADVERKIRLLEEEQRAVGKSAVEIEKVKIQQELLNAANKAGLNDQGQLNGQIDALAQKAAEAQVKLDEMRAAQERTKQATENFISTTSDLAGTFAIDFKNGLQEGMTAAESFRAAMGNMVNAVADMLLRLAAQMAIVFALQAAGVPVPANMMPALPFGGGRASGGEVLPGRRYRVGEMGPEDVVFGRRGVVIPAKASARAGGTQVAYSPSMVINAPGADTAALKAYVDAGFQKMRGDIPAIVRSQRWAGRMP